MSVVTATNLSLWYGDFRALIDVNLVVERGEILALIGPSGCGKSTLLRALNRMNDAPTTRTTGGLVVAGHDVQGPNADVIRLRRDVGMVFQRPNPLPMSIRDNVLFGLRLHRGLPDVATQAEITRAALTRVGLWASVADRLTAPADVLSLEDRQKLCIARLLPLAPAVLLLDEPCSALDPEGTLAIEQLMGTLRGTVTQVIVTHNLAQARRVSDRCAYMLLGELVELGPTAELFANPRDPRTRAYLGGALG
jgi:phosphate transport system ATP-binding protein